MMNKSFNKNIFHKLLKKKVKFLKMEHGHDFTVSVFERRHSKHRRRNGDIVYIISYDTYFKCKNCSYKDKQATFRIPGMKQRTGRASSRSLIAILENHCFRYGTCHDYDNNKLVKELMVL